MERSAGREGSLMTRGEHSPVVIARDSRPRPRVDSERVNYSLVLHTCVPRRSREETATGEERRGTARNAAQLNENEESWMGGGEVVALLSSSSRCGRCSFFCSGIIPAFPSRETRIKNVITGAAAAAALVSSCASTLYITGRFCFLAPPSLSPASSFPGLPLSRVCTHVQRHIFARGTRKFAKWNRNTV